MLSILNPYVRNVEELGLLSHPQVLELWKRPRLRIDEGQVSLLAHRMGCAWDRLPESTQEAGARWYSDARREISAPIWERVTTPAGETVTRDKVKRVPLVLRGAVAGILSQRSSWKRNMEDYHSWIGHYVNGVRLSTYDRWSEGRGLRDRWKKVRVLEDMHAMEPGSHSGLAQTMKCKIPWGLGPKIGVFAYNLSAGKFPHGHSRTLALWCHDTHMHRWLCALGADTLDILGVDPAGRPSLRVHALCIAAASRVGGSYLLEDSGASLQASLWIAQRGGAE